MQEILLEIALNQETVLKIVLDVMQEILQETVLRIVQEVEIHQNNLMKHKRQFVVFFNVLIF